MVSHAWENSQQMKIVLITMFCEHSNIPFYIIWRRKNHLQEIVILRELKFRIVTTTFKSQGFIARFAKQESWDIVMPTMRS